MPLTVTVPCSDVAATADFYALLFSGAPNVRAHVAEIAVGDDVYFKFVETAPPIASHAFAFNAWNVAALAEQIDGAIPPYDGTVETMPPGTAWGPYDYPGGLGLAITDPDGHYLSFVEW